VQNVLGFGLKEKVYQSALAKEFKNRDIKFREQVQAEIMYNKEVVGKRYFDFLVKDKIIVELKVGDHFNKQIFFQINEYLKVSGLELGLIIMFTAQDVRVRRVVNLI